MITIVLLIVSLLIFILWETRKPKNFPPGPPRLPLLGYLPYLSSHLPHKQLRDLSHVYGPVVGIYVGRTPCIVANSYESVKEALLNHDMQGRPPTTLAMSRNYGKTLGIMFTEGELWENQRHFALNQFQNLSFGRSHESIIHDELQNLVDDINAISGPFSIQDILEVSSVNVLWSIMCGQRFKTGDPRLQQMVQQIKKPLHSGGPFGTMASQLPILKPLLIKMSNFSSVGKGLNKFRDFIMDTVQEHKETFRKDDIRDFLDAYLLEMQTTGDKNFSEQQLVALCMDIFAAGVETSASLISFCVLFICLHPSVQKGAQNEIDKVVGKSRYATMTDREKLPYVDAVYTEVFRFRCPAVNTVPHLTKRDTTLQGYSVPKNTLVLPNLYAVFNDPSHWGDPGIFRPTRFLDKDRNFKVEERFFPFGKGRRSCLGESLAKMTTFLTFVTLLQRFCFHFDPHQLLRDTEGSSGFSLSPPKFKVVASLR